MALTKHRIGDLISVCDERNSYGLTNFHGLNINKQFMPTVADTNGLDESKYKVVRNKRFVFSGMQTGRDECIRISMYTGDEPIIVSPAYTTFEVSREDIVLPEYFFMIFLSKEKDRWGAFCSDSSIRTNLDWERFEGLELTLPSIATQHKFVDVYSSIRKNLEIYLSHTADIKVAYTSAIERLKAQFESVSILPYLAERQEINKSCLYTDLKGVGNEGFIEPRGNRDEVSFSKCNIFYPKDFVYNPSVIAKGAIAYNNRFSTPKICTEEYIVFYVKDERVLLPEYLFIWMKRKETGRFLEWVNMDSVRNRVYFRDLHNVKIPIPSIEVQKSIAALYSAYYERQSIAADLKALLSRICPVLIQGSLKSEM